MKCDCLNNDHNGKEAWTEPGCESETFSPMYSLGFLLNSVKFDCLLTVKCDCLNNDHNGKEAWTEPGCESETFSLMYSLGFLLNS